MTEVNGYKILTPFTQVNAGQSEWAQAMKGGQKYFIKRFLSPTLTTMGSPKTKEYNRRLCDEFEHHHTDMMRRLEEVSSGDGNLVITQDFFREGAKYYKVTEWVETTANPLAEVWAMSRMDKFVVALTAVHCVQGLHQASIVHGDLKPNNILIMKSAASFVSRLIDFDDSFVSGAPPLALVGTIDYYSPEVFRYIKDKGDGAGLTTKSDIFALGIILSEYFVGRRPKAKGEGKQPDTIAEAVIKGLPIDTGLDSGLDVLIQRMLKLSPNDRPTCFDVIRDLQALKAGRSISSDREPTIPPHSTADIRITTTIKKPATTKALVGDGELRSRPPEVRRSESDVEITGPIPGLFGKPTVDISGSLIKR